MPNKDFTANFRKATTVGNLTLAQAWDFNDVTALVQAADRLRLVRYPRRAGNFALEVECRQNDVDGGPTARTEIFTTNASQTPFALGDTVWMATSLFVPANMPAVPSWLVFHQEHNGGIGSPAFALEYTGNQFHVSVRGGSRTGSGSPTRNNSYTLVTTPTLGVWHDFLVKITWATDGTGVCDVYYREVPTSGAVPAFPGTPQLSAPGANVVIQDGTTVLPAPPRISTYRDDLAATTVITHGGYIMRRTRAHAEAIFTDSYNLATEIAADAPRRYYRLNETSGTVATDAGSDLANGTFTNSPTLSGASLLRSGTGHSVNFTPANSWVNCGDVSLAETATEWTYELMYQTSITTLNRTVLAEGRSSTVSNSYLYVDCSDRVTIVMSDDAATTFQPSARSFPNYTQIGDGDPHHILMRFSKTTHLVECFVDGEFEFQITGFTPTAFTLNTFAIGGFKANITNPYRQAGNTNVSEVAVYDKWLTDDRVQAHALAAFREQIGSVPVGPVITAPVGVRYLVRP